METCLPVGPQLAARAYWLFVFVELHLGIRSFAQNYSDTYIIANSACFPGLTSQTPKEELAGIAKMHLSVHPSLQLELSEQPPKVFSTSQTPFMKKN